MLRKRLVWLAVFIIVALLVAPILSACAGAEGPQGPQGSQGPEGAQGPQGAQGPAGTSSGTVSGTVTNSLTTGPLAGATVKLEPAVDQASLTTDASGKYTVSLPIGTYTLTFERANFASSTETVSVIAGKTATRDGALKPTSPVVVSAGKDQSSSPGGTVTLKATVETLDGSSVTGYQWTQTAGVAASSSGAASATASVTLGNAAAYKGYLFEKLKTLDRFVVQAINPHSLEEAEEATFKVTVTTSKGTYSDTVNVVAHLPYVVNTGIENVPVNVPVLLHGKTQDAYGWALTAPTGSQATLGDATGQNPLFTPDVTGKYTVAEANSGAAIDVYAGTWVGVITGQDDKGEPVADTSCTTCHNGTIAPDMFTPWKASGHAEIFTQNIDNPSGHWSLGCASCHTVGYNPDADNNGFDEAVAQEGWEVPHGAIGNFAQILADNPKTASLTNIQCENCHGPQQSAAHMQGAPRVDISSDVCGACHGEPPRHGRFQQWEESKHADYTLATSRGTSSSCGRCHAGQGFLAWLPQLQAGDPGNITAEITWTADTAEPQTCVVCHDPHEQGKSSGEPNTATVRIEGDTPMLPAGFKALGVGRGALCITCHNTRNGAHNDAVTTTMDDQAPHTAAQADVLMGQNAYFVEVGERAAHSFIEDTCANCHMEQSPPPAELSYNLGGTNHSFEASQAICGNCHGAYDGGTLEEAIEAQLEELKVAIEQALIAEITAQTAAGNTVTLKKMGPNGTDVAITDGSAVSAIELTESHGRAAMDITVGGTTYEHVRLASDTAVNGGTLLSSAAGQTIAKAAWNFFLIEGDGSHGVHNPSFTVKVLNAALEALE